MKQPALIVASGLLLLPAFAFAQAISYVTPGAQVTENFDNEDGWNPSGAVSAPWNEGQTFNGWYGLYFDGRDGGSYSVPPTFSISQGGQFSSAANNLYLFRIETNPQDGALGTQITDGKVGLPALGGGVFFGVRIQNDTGSELTGFSLGYTGEQWRTTTSANASSFTVSYSTDASEIDGVWLNNGSWTDIPDLYYAAPRTSESSNTALDGNAADNRTVLGPQSVSLASALAPGESLYIRWFSPNVGGTDHSIGVDDFVFTAIPEPRTYALIFGAAVLVAAGARRIRREKRG